LGILGIENRKLNIFFLSFLASNNQNLFFYFFIFLRVRAASVRTGCVHTDATARPRRASEGVQWEGEGKEMTSSMRMQGSVYADASLFTTGNFITDAIVRPSHGRPSGHRPSVHPSVIVRVTTLCWCLLILINCFAC
jgi:hypothetical protein